MSDKKDALLQQIGELTSAIKEHKSDPATIDYEKIAEELAKAQAGLAPIYRGAQPSDGDWIGPEGAKAYNPVITSGKFAGMRRGDLQFVDTFLRKAARVSEHVVLPSAELTKAMTSIGGGIGDELVPDAWASELWKDIFAASLVLGNLPTPIAMPADPFELPLGLGSVTFYKGTQNTPTSPTDLTTAKSQLASTELVGEVNWSYHLDEDAVVAMLPAIRDQLRIDASHYIDCFILNADSETGSTGNINKDNGAPAGTEYWMTAGQNGIRHQWLGDNAAMGVNSGGSVALSDTNVLAALALMGKYVQPPDRLRIVCDFSTYIKGFMNLDAVITVDKYGPAAVVVTGELGRYRGVPIVPSTAHPLTMSDGKCNTTGNTLGSASIFHSAMWRTGFRRELLIEVDKDIQKRMLIMVVSFRIAVAAHGTRASATHTAGIYNILVA